jgi:hypothetical protein
VSEEPKPEAKKEADASLPSPGPVATPLFERPVAGRPLAAAPSPGPAQDGPPVPSKTPEQLFEEARSKANLFLQQQGVPGKPTVDKYFGSKLPPVCRQLGCYVTDDGKFFYCINPHCHKDKKRETKYNRRKKSVVYFFCPKCKSREIQLHLKMNNYECLDCAYTWKH